MADTNKRKNLNISQNICMKKVKHFRNESNTTLATSSILNEIDPSSKYAVVGGISSIRVVNTQTANHDERITTNISPVLDENLINLNPLSPILGNEFNYKSTQMNQVTVHGTDHKDLNAKNTAKISSKLKNVRSIHHSSLEIVNSSNFDRDSLEHGNYPNRDQELLIQLPVLNSPTHKLLPIPTNIDNLGYVPVNDPPKSPVLDSRQYKQISAKPKTPIKDTWSKLKSNYFEKGDSNYSLNQFEANVLIENCIANERCQNQFEHTNDAIGNSDEIRNNKVSSATQFKPTFIHSSTVEDRPLSPILDSSQSRSKVSCVPLPCAQSVAGIPTTSELLNTFEQKNEKTNVNHPMNHLHNHRPDSIVSREKILDTRIDPELFTSDSLLINKSKPLSPILDSSECKNDFTLKSSCRTSSESQLVLVKNTTTFKAFSTKNNNLVNKSPHLVSNGESMLSIYNEHESVIRSDQSDLKLSEICSLGNFNLSPKLTDVSCGDLNNKSSSSPYANIASIQPQDCRNKLLRSLDLDSSCLITNCNNYFKPGTTKELKSSFDSSKHHSLCVRDASNERSPILSDLNLENPFPGSSIKNFTSNHMPMLSSRLTQEGYERLEIGEISPSPSIRTKTSKDELSVCSKTNKSILLNSSSELDFPKVKPKVQTILVQLSGEHKSQLSSDELLFTSNDSNEAPGVNSVQKEYGYNVKVNQTNKEEYSISAESASSLSTVKRKLDFNHVDIDNVASSQDEINQLFITSPQRKENCVRHEVKRHLNTFKNISLNEIDKKHGVIIEEFDDSPSKSDINISFRESQITIVNERLSPCLDSPYKISQNFKRQNLKNTNKLDVMNDVQDCFDALEKLDFEANIEEDLSQESVKSNDYKIECSTSPLTKSYEGTQSLEIVSFPPALDVATTSCDSKAIDVLDSACKTKKLKVKRGSLVERLRRVIRAEKAEVNMFHHEAPGSQQEGVCLRVNGITKTASRLVLTCKYAAKPRSNYSDPEIKLIIEPDLNKKITVNSNILVYPPWKSDWLDSRQVLLLYRVSKVRLSPEISVPSSTIRSLNQAMLLQRFSCTPQTLECGCLKELMNQLFLVPQGSQGTVPAAHSVSAALSDPRPPQHVMIKFNVLHRFSTRYENNVVQSLLCLDEDSCIFQFNLPTLHDVKKAELLLGETSSGTFLVNDVTLCDNIFIDRYKGLRSMLTTLNNDSTNQQLMYIVYPSSEHWSVTLNSSLLNAKQMTRLPTLAEAQGTRTESRVECEVQVLALRANQLYAWDRKKSAQIKLKLDPAAVLPNLVVRANLMIRYMRYHLGLLTIDRFSTVTVKESEGELNCSPPIPFLGLTSQPGDLVFLDAVVSSVGSEVQLRWEGPCGHSLVRMPEPLVFFCQSCYRPTECRRQKIVMEVGIVVIDLLPPVRVKVKSETAQLLLDIPGELTSAKKYNMIRAIGASLKCLAVVVETLRNPYGDILEIYVEEL